METKKRKAQSFEYGAIILICSTVLVKIIGAIFKIPLSNLIGDLGFGYFSSAYDLFTPIYNLAMAGLPIAISRVVAERITAERYLDVRKSLKVTKRIFLITGVTAFLVMLALIYPFVKITDPTGKTVYSLFAISPALITCCIMSSYRGYYEGLRNMYPTAISDVIEASCKLVLGFGFAFIIMKASGNVALAAAGAMLGITVGSICASIFLKLYHKIKGDGITEEELALSPEAYTSRQTAKTLILIAVPVVLSSLANSVASLVDVSMVKWQLSNLVENSADVIRNMYSASISDYNSVSEAALTNAQIPTFLYGVRGKAFTLYNLVPTITSVLGVSALPVLASAWTLKDNGILKKNIESMLKLPALICMPAGFGFLALGDRIMGLMYNTTASSEIGGMMLRIYGITVLFAGLSFPLTNMLQAINKQVVGLRNIAIGAALKVIVNFILVGIPGINIQGAAIGSCVCYGFIFIANLISLVKGTGVKPNFFKTIIKPLISGALCGITAFAVSRLVDGSIGTVVSIAVAALVYFVALVVLNTFEADDFLALPKGKKLLNIASKLKILR